MFLTDHHTIYGNWRMQILANFLCKAVLFFYSLPLGFKESFYNLYPLSGVNNIWIFKYWVFKFIQSIFNIKLKLLKIFLKLIAIIIYVLLKFLLHLSCLIFQIQLNISNIISGNITCFTWLNSLPKIFFQII